MADRIGSEGGPEPVAIVSMAGRFPGAADTRRFWANQRAGVEAISTLNPSDLLLADRDVDDVLHPGFVGAEGLYPHDAALFDAQFFGYSPREAALMDPQHRALLELAWEAFDTIGLDPLETGGTTGVFLAAALSTYLLRNLIAGGRDRQRAAQRRDGMHLLMHNDKDFAPGTVSYKLGLTGPSLAVGSACSSSLAAVHLAGRALQGYECDLALAGGAAIQIPQGSGYIHTDDSVYSPDGRCAPFDASAAGTVGGSGAGVVLLKRLSDALRDGDPVVALILGSAVTNDGADKIGYTAPSAAGQAAAVLEAHAVAGIKASSIGYLEAHGTGTRLGDPIEIEALTRAFQATGAHRGCCALGSAKANIGHLDAAAGVAGLVVAASAVRDGVVPPLLHFRIPNQEARLAESPFFAPTEASPWPLTRGPRRAGVSSFGIGGTNVHLVVEQAPESARTHTGAGVDDHPLTLVLSARSAQALETTASHTAEVLRESGAPEGVAATLAGRRAMTYRRTVTARSAEEAARLLAQGGSATMASGRQAVFLFPGQGELDRAAVHGLTALEPVFAESLRTCAGHLRVLGFDLPRALESDPAAVPPQPVLVAVEYALGRTLVEAGLRPAAFAGHSLGEYAAAALAGVMSLEDCLRLTLLRERLSADLPAGRMLAVALSEPALDALLPPGAQTAVVNAPDRCVAAGPPEVIERLASRLRARRIGCRLLPLRTAFHTAAVEPMLTRFAEAFDGVRLSDPGVPIFSSFDTAASMTSAEYWVEQLRRPVRAADAIERCLGMGAVALAEVGPTQGLPDLARRHPAYRDHIEHADGHLTVSVMPTGAADSAPASLDLVLARLWTAGCRVEWRRRSAGASRRVAVPAERLERGRHWIEAPAEPVNLPSAAELAAEIGGVAALGRPVPRSVDDYPGLRPGLERLCAQAGLWTLCRGGVDLRRGTRHCLREVRELLRVLPAYTGLLDVLLDAAERDGALAREAEEITVLREPTAAETDGSALADHGFALAADHPEFAGLIELLTHCARGYPRALSQPGEALRLLYPGGRSDLLARTLGERTIKHRSIEGLGELLGRMLDRLARGLGRPVRVLEFGAGGGNLTRILATRLGADRLVYHATDLAPAFVAALAAEARGRGLTAVRASVLDIRKDPALQGLAGHRYDLICGLDALHATPDLRRSIAQLRTVLAPGGIFALLETTASDPWLPLIWGLAEDWWTATDGRTGGPLLGADGWRLLFEAADFADSTLVLPDAGPGDSALIIAREHGSVAAMPAAGSAAAPDWPIKRPDPASWCYRPGWRHLAPARPIAPAQDEACLLLSTGPLGADVARRLEGFGARVIVATSEDMASGIVGRLAATGPPVRLVVHLWPLEEAATRGTAAGSRDIDECQARGIHTLLELARALGAAPQREPVRLVTATCGAQDVLGGETAHPEYATVNAAVKVVPRECPWISCTSVDFAPDAVSARPRETAGLIVDELLAAAETTVAAYRGRRRFGPQHTADPLDPRFATGLRVRGDGGYLLCGGLGGIGLSIAERIAAAPARLVLTARSAFPDPAQWGGWPETGDRVSRAVHRLDALRKAGSDIRVLRADVADAARMTEVVAWTERELGPLRGVVHAAGVLDTAGVVQRRDRRETDAAMRAKVKGLTVLDEVVGDRELDFFVLCSSIGATLYKLKFGEVGYVAGNEFADAFAEYRASRRAGLTLAIAWSDWLEDGMWASARDRLSGRYVVAAGGSGSARFDPDEDVLGGLTAAEGKEVFARLVGGEVSPRAIVSTQDLDELLTRHARFSTGDHLAAVSRLTAAQARRTTPAALASAARTVSAAPEAAERNADPLQRTIAEFYCELLGLPAIGPEDDFFALGGDSLLALRLQAMVRDAYGVEISMARVLQTPTVAGLADAVEQAGHRDRSEEVVV